MSATQSPIYLAPFDGIADRYDEVFTSSRIGRAQRASVWKELEKTFHAGDHVLEVGCGTGVDACFLAARGVHVLACDSSPRMIAVAASRVKERQLVNLVLPRLMAAEEIASLRTRRLFDGAYSNFGALNCVPDIGRLARDLATLLRPGAAALLCWMGPCCLWEILWYLAQAKPGKALRRLRRGGVTARLNDGAPVHVYYPSVRSLARTFAPEFSLKSIKGVGVAVPPSYLEPIANRFPSLLGAAVFADFLLGRCPGIRVLADHVLVRFEREDV